MLAMTIDEALEFSRKTQAPDGTPVALRRGMSRSTTPSRFLADTPYPDREDSGERTYSRASCRERFIDRPGLGPLQLEALTALTANDRDETTLTVSGEENQVLLVCAFESDDDEITIEAPVPEIPPRTPSPLGEPLARKAAAPDRDGGSKAAFSDRLVLEAEDEAPPTPRMLLTHEELVSRINGEARPSAALQHAPSLQALREARAAAARARQDEATTRMVVLAIWGAAIVLAGLLAFFALSA
jgi:hypothetical protein